MLGKKGNYWQDLIKKNVPVLKLPLYQKNNALRESDQRELKQDTQIRESVFSIAQKCDIQPTSVLFAIFTSLLSRYANQDEFIIGLLNNNSDEKNPVGVISKYLPVFVSIDYKLTTKSLLSAIDNQFKAAVENADSCSDFLEGTIKDSYYQVGYEWISLGKSSTACTSNQLHQDKNQSNFWMTVFDDGSILTFLFRYTSQQFSDSFVQSFSNRLIFLLKNLIDNLTMSFTDVPIITGYEKASLAKSWNKTRRDIPASTTVHRIFESQVDKTPERIALICGTQSFTYKQLDIRSNRVANLIRSLGIKPSMAIGLYMDRSADMLVSLLGILKAGAAYVPLDPQFPSERINSIVTDSEMPIILTKSNLSGGLLFFSGRCICLDDPSSELSSSSQNRPSTDNTTQKDLAYLIYTSGSTGRPKGVEITHGSVVNFLLSMIEKPGFNQNDIVCAVTTISFDISVLELFGPLCVGACTVILDKETCMDPVHISKAISLNRATVMQATPATWRMMVASGWSGSPDLKILCGGEALRYDLATELLSRSCELWNMYGPTETTVWSTCCKISKSDNFISAGSPIANTKLYVLDEHLQPLPAEIPGDLYIGGMGVAKGYHNKPVLTDSKFVKDPFSDSDEARMYATGDKARFLGNGEIDILGRSDFQIKIRGFRIEPGEIEIALRSHSGIKDAIVVASDGGSGEKILAAYIVKSTHTLKIEEIKDYCAGILPHYMVPSVCVFLEHIPLTPNGKVDVRSLPQVIEQNENVTLILPHDETELQIAEIWKRILLIDKIGIHDSFFDIGGTSLTTAVLTSELRKQFTKEISVGHIFQYPTIHKLAEFIADSANGKDVYKRVCQRAEKNNSDPASVRGVAVIGMSGRFPGADSIQKLWSNLAEGLESVAAFSKDELDQVDEELRNDPAYVAARGIISDIDKFDAAFFAIRPNEAQIMDPQQRVLLETAWAALEDAGYSAEHFDGLIGVYAGMGNNSYYKKNVCAHPELIKRVGEIIVELGTEKDHIAPRISYAMNLNGPSLSIHTACSTTLVVIDSAFHALVSHQCDMALAGGIDINLPQKSGQIYQDGGIFTKDGHCRPFDAEATGTMFGEASCMVVLKRLEDAIADRDTIHAVILGTAVNHDGSRKVNYLAPSIDAQAEVIALAQQRARIHPESIGYIETHGTATPIGDPIEIEALTKAFRLKTQKKQFCAIGSIKGNIGHSTTAAGIVGFIKTVLVLNHRQIPPSINFSRANPRIDFENSPFFVNIQLRKWNEESRPCRAGVSSFGFCGTNAHMILEEPPSVDSDTLSRLGQLLMFSAKSNAALQRITDNFRNFLKEKPDVNLADAAFTLQKGRNYFNHRKFIVCSSASDAIALLTQADPKRCGSRLFTESVPQIVFLFPGQGSQYINMGKSIYRDEAVFRDCVDTCAKLLIPHLGRDIRELLFPLLGDEETATVSLLETRYTQPAIFIIEYSLAQLWKSWGISPRAMIGHSIGEFVCACLSGVFALEDALMLVAMRGKLMQDLPRGTMLSVRLDYSTLVDKLPSDISVAAVNGPELCVISGPNDSVSCFATELEKNGVVCRQLYSSHAFHSSMMDPVVEPFQRYVEKISLSSPKIPFVSTVSGTWITPAQAKDPSYWANHLRSPVKFSQAIAEILKESALVLLEVGPRATSATLARQQITDTSRHSAIASLSDTNDNESEWTALLKAVGSLWMWGIVVDWNVFYKNEKRKRIQLPTYPFERTRYWVDPGVKQKEIYENTIIEESMTEHLAEQQDPRPVLLKKVGKLIEEMSGTIIQETSYETSFLELGLDSLVLTQIARALTREMSVQISFRQLMENITSVELLTNHLLTSLPQDTLQSLMPKMQRPSSVQKPSIAANSVSVSSPHIETGSNTLEQLVIRQMDIIERLVALLEEKNKNPLSAKSYDSDRPELTEKTAAIDEPINCEENKIMCSDNPPVPGARLGRDENGNPTWFIPDPLKNGNYIRLGSCS